MDPRLAAQGIAHLATMGEGPVQVIRPSGMVRLFGCPRSRNAHV